MAEMQQKARPEKVLHRLNETELKTKTPLNDASMYKITTQI